MSNETEKLLVESLWWSPPSPPGSRYVRLDAFARALTPFTEGNTVWVVHRLVQIGDSWEYDEAFEDGHEATFNTEAEALAFVASRRSEETS